ncbi:glycosyl transferase group 1 [Rhodovulum sp. PH10]|uniref:glycosyltransferase family 4 protein n=1 Tax=Rhodovulum sp. PH10 TaxID=1187851 RepID=UPI00027C1EB1|nr:glycosyltransferase family 4 protein [Rhodovulum sp. PH10]EJW09780.1 glycosyl transferase group 1 [Rhodovulum sp. PH10]
MKRVLVAAATVEAGRGGIARVARMSARALAESRYSVTCISYLDQSAVELGGERSHVAKGNKLHFLALCQAASLRADFCLYDSAGIARARARLPGLRRPYAVWMHGIEAWENLSPAASDALRGAALVLVNSHYTLRRFEALHGVLPTARVCLLGTEDDAPAQAPRIAAEPRVLILSRIEEAESYKGHAELIAAWPGVVARIPAARLVIAGGGSGVGRIREAAARSPVDGNIDVLGFVPEAQVAEQWAQATVLAMPSRGEGFGLVYIEAMRLGLPVIASVHDAGEEVNVDGTTGFNVSLDHDGELTERIVMLLGDAELAAHMGDAGRTRWTEHFCYSAFRARFRSAIDGLFSDATSRP